MSQPLPGGDGYQTEQELRRWAAAVEAKAARYQTMQAEVAEVTATEYSRDDIVRVTVGSSGIVTDLEISDRAREMTGAELSSLVLNTMRRAQSRITDQVADVMQRTVGDDPATVASVVESYRQRFPEPEPDEDLRRPDDELRLGDMPDAEHPYPSAPPPPPAPPGRPRRSRDDEDDDWGGPNVFG